MATTQRHRALVGRMVENAGSEPLYRTFLAVGYSHAVASHPKRVIDSVGFQELLRDTGVTPAKIAKTIEEGLTATKLFGKNAIQHPDYSTRHKFAETGVKLLGLISDGPLAPAAGATYNTFITQNNIDPASASAKELMEVTLDALMAQTKRKKVPNDNQG